MLNPLTSTQNTLISVKTNKAIVEKGIILTGAIGSLTKDLELEIGVCGSETIKVVDGSELSYISRHAQVNGTSTKHEVVVGELDKVFKFEQNQGFAECDNEEVKLCLDEECSKTWKNEKEIITLSTSIGS